MSCTDCVIKMQRIENDYGKKKCFVIYIVCPGVDMMHCHINKNFPVRLGKVQI